MERMGQMWFGILFSTKYLLLYSCIERTDQLPTSTKIHNETPRRYISKYK